MTLRKVIIALTFISVFAMGLRISTDSDTWWHLRTGDLIRETRQVPLQDSFSHTLEGADWYYPSAAWISQVAMSYSYEAGGSAALNVGVAMIATMSLALLYFALDGGPFQRAFMLVLTAATSAVFWSARPHMATYLFFAGFVLVLNKTQTKNKKLLWLLPLLLIVWVNSHPGFAAAFILYGIHFVGELFTFIIENRRNKREKIWTTFKQSKLAIMLLVGLVLVPVVTINPSGAQMLRYPFDTLSIGVLRDFIQEWQSPNFHDGATLPFLFSILFGFILMGNSRQKLTATEGLIYAVFGSMALLAGRNIALFALAVAPMFSRHLTSIIDDWQNNGLRSLTLDQTPTILQSISNFSIIGLAILALVIKAGQVLPDLSNQKVFQERFPVQAVEFIQAHGISGRLYNSYNFGGYLIYALPENKVFLDGRTDLYAAGLLEEWLEIASAQEGWQKELENYGIELVIIEDYWPLAHRLEAEGWDKIYADELASIYINN